VPIKHLHEDLRPSVGTLAAAYKTGDRTPIWKYPLGLVFPPYNVPFLSCLFVSFSSILI
jgi:hypothetical protein